MLNGINVVQTLVFGFRSLWKRVYAVVVLAVIVTLILGLSALGVCLIWRSRQPGFIAYKPVNAAIPEHELQPL